MRATQVRQMLVDAIEAIEPDTSAGLHDRFRHDPWGSQNAPDRTFSIVLDAPPRHRGNMTSTSYSVAYAVVVQYGLETQIVERMECDAERIHDALIQIPGSHAVALTVLSSAVGADDELSSIELQIVVEIEYDLDILT